MESKKKKIFPVVAPYGCTLDPTTVVAKSENMPSIWMCKIKITSLYCKEMALFLSSDLWVRSWISFKSRLESLPSPELFDGPTSSLTWPENRAQDCIQTAFCGRA
jgi:hypothetical protein